MSYQAIYDAVRSKISTCDPREAVCDAIRESGIGEMRVDWSNAVNDIRSEYCRPSAVYRPSISIDGNKWCALYGENLQDGVAGFGDSPAQAMQDFDRKWFDQMKVEVRA